MRVCGWLALAVVGVFVVMVFGRECAKREGGIWGEAASAAEAVHAESRGGGLRESIL